MGNTAKFGEENEKKLKWKRTGYLACLVRFFPLSFFISGEYITVYYRYGQNDHILMYLNFEFRNKILST